MPTNRSAFRLLPEFAGAPLQTVTKSISAKANAEVRNYMTERELNVIGENSRRQVMARGPETFYKSLTSDSARRLQDFYPLLERAALASGFVPRLYGIDRIDAQVSVASFQFVPGRTGITNDTADCLALYAEMQLAASRNSPDTAQSLADVCRTEVSTWTEDLLQSWDPINWTDPKVLEWAGTDAAGLIEVGIPGLRSVSSLIAAFPPESLCAPVHADLYIGNYLRTPTGQGVLVDWDEGYWGLPGMGLQILMSEAMGSDLGKFDYKTVLEIAPPFAEMGLDESALARRTLASSVVEIAGIRQSLRELGRTRERHAAYLAAWACRYNWVIENAKLDPVCRPMRTASEEGVECQISDQ